MSTIGMPWLAWVFAPKAKRGGEIQTGSVPSLEVLVVAYNEQDVIRETLASLVAAAAQVRADIRIVVGLDHCSDRTEEIVREIAATSSTPIEAVQNLGERGKWNTLLMLFGRSRADWVACVDSGSVWHPALLQKALPLMGQSGVLGVAPSYCPRDCGRFERANWWLERTLKNLENMGGGPVSVHGASVLYRRETLLSALSFLHGTAWLNDDVVIPLTLRMRNPGSRIVYLANGAEPAWVSDVGVRADLKAEFGRRRRMVLGNLQWIRGVLLPQLSVLLIAARRVFRVCWAYWVLFTIVGFGAFVALALNDVSGAHEIARAVLIELGALAMVFAAVGGLLFSNWVRRLAMAFGSGLMVTRYWKEIGLRRGVSWT